MAIPARPCRWYRRWSTPWRRVPVVAAGGIADGRGLAAALMLGAAGVACGTAFYASEEALAHPAAKVPLVVASGDATQRSVVADVRPAHRRGPSLGRSGRSRTSSRPLARPTRSGLRGDAGEIERYARAREAGDFDTAAVIAGEAADWSARSSPRAGSSSGWSARPRRCCAAAPPGSGGS